MEQIVLSIILGICLLVTIGIFVIMKDLYSNKINKNQKSNNELS